MTVAILKMILIYTGVFTHGKADLQIFYVDLADLIELFCLLTAAMAQPCMCSIYIQCLQLMHQLIGLQQFGT